MLTITITCMLLRDMFAQIGAIKNNYPEFKRDIATLPAFGVI
jgi:hypothetical protein